MRNQTSVQHGALRRFAALTVIIPLALLAASCGGDDDSTATGSGGGGGNSDMTVKISTPSDGADVDEPFDVKLDSSVDLGETDTGLHHVHLYYDGKTGGSDYDKVYSDSFTVDRDLGSGEHTIKAVIANADHSLTDASDEITVNVGKSGSGGGTGTTDSDDSGY